MQISRKAQEEIVGFVVIVVLVSVALVVFLGIAIRTPPTPQQDSALVYQFLDSAMEQTTSCTLSENGNPLKLDELVKECFETHNSCFNGNNTCIVAEQTWFSMLNASWTVGQNYPLKGYNLTAVYRVNSSASNIPDTLFSIAKGNCSSGLYTGSSYSISESPGSINNILVICT